MNAILAKARADLRRRKLQSVVITVVILLSSLASTLALNLLVESDAPYDHAFAQANGAHLTGSFAADKVTVAQLQATASAPGVTETAGPWEFTTIFITAPGGRFGNDGFPVTVVGRDSPQARPDITVDRLTMIDGRWATAPGEAVLAQSEADNLGLTVGDVMTTTPDTGGVTLKIVGIAASITNETGAWVAPGQVAALVQPKAGLHYQMLYRVSPANTSDDLHTVSAAISKMLPEGAVEGMDNYLDAKINADRTSAVMIPFLLAFSGFALLAAAFIIANIVAGVVIAGYREIGIMKSVGFTPSGVVASLLIQILVPVSFGCLLGVPIGMFLSQPFLRDTAHALGLPVAFTASVPVILGVLAIVLAITVLAAFFPALRAGRMSAAYAITAGSAPAPAHNSGAGRALLSMPLPRSLSLGLADAFARPMRSALTTGAIIIGVATIVFALGLHNALDMVGEALNRDQSVQVTISRQQDPTDAAVVSMLQADPNVARFVADGTYDVAVPGIAGPVPYYGYRGDASWVGYAIIEGRWFSAPGEVVAPTKLLKQANLRVGDSFISHINGKAVTLKLVGSIFDQQGDNLLLRGDWQTPAGADPRFQVSDYELQLKPGVNPDRYAYQLMSQLGGNSIGKSSPGDKRTGSGVRIDVARSASQSTTFLLLNSVIVGLALILTVIAVAGVFNTVILNTREQVRDIAILKAVGMSPGQVVAMVVVSVATLGLVGGALGLPLGLVLQRQILTMMGQIATETDIPPSFFDVIAPLLLPLLVLAGVLVAALGAWLPAHWAAYSRVAEVLQSE